MKPTTTETDSPTLAASATDAPTTVAAATMPLHALPAPGSDWFWGIWSVVAAFGTYFCMYGFRTPYTTLVDLPGDALVWGLSFKVVMVIAWNLGYMGSKFIGIKVISEMPPERRAIGILTLVGLGELALVGFGLTARPWSAGWLFFNALALGMVFGLVLGFLEGRRATEALAAGLCTSFILADGMTKSVGAWLLERNVPDGWMPALAGLIFAGPLLGFVWMLSRVPPPNRADVAERAERSTLTRSERWSLYGKYWFGLTAIITAYLLISILRRIRSDFSPELFAGLRTEARPQIFSQTEMLVALGVMVVNGALVLVRNSRWAFFASLGVCAAGLLLMMVALLGLPLGMLDGFSFMALVGLGLYLPYVAVHTTVFERFLAMTRERGNLGFLMYVADSIGYFGVVGVLIAKSLVKVETTFVHFFLTICWFAAALSLVCFLGSWIYFATRTREQKHFPAEAAS